MPTQSRKCEAPVPPAPPFPEYVYRLAALAALLFGATMGFVRQSPGFFDAYVCNDDARQQLYWMAGFHNAALFQNDILVDYARHYVGPGVAALYWLLTLVWPPVLAGKLVAVALMALGAYWCFNVGRRLADLAGGAAAAILFAGSQVVAERVAGGNPRAFAFPLLAALLCYLLRREHVKVALVAVAAALTYPMIFLLGAPVWLADAVGIERFRPALDRSRRRWIPTAVGLFAGAAILGANHLSIDPRFGPTAGRERVLSDPAFRAGGRFAEVLGDGKPGFWRDAIQSAGAPLGLRGRWDGADWERTNPSWCAPALAVVAGAWMLLALLGTARMPRPFVGLALSSLLWCGVAWAVVFRLFVPPRYLQFSLPLLLLLGMAILLATPALLPRSLRIRRLATMACIAAAALIGYALDRVRPDRPQINLARAADFWQAIERAVPPDSVIAGDFDLLDNVGVFSRRKAYLCHELAHPAYTRYYDDIVAPRIRRTLAALLSPRPADVLRFAAEERVDYLLFDADAVRDGTIRCYQPFIAARDELRAAAGGQPPCVLAVTDPARIAANFGGRYRLLRISPGPGNAFGVETTALNWSQSFDGLPAGMLPPGWNIRTTGKPAAPAEWSVRSDPSARSRPHVLSLTRTANAGSIYNLLLADAPPAADVDLSVSVRADSGREDQGGGPIWRCRDENNYYICRVNPLEGNYRVYKVTDGRRTQLATADVPMESGRWYTLRAVMVGDQIACYLDGRKLLEARDEAIRDAGRVGLWTKADAASSFDEMRLAEP